MSLGRRAFLQFVGGAIGGTLLSPIPWKLADDSAIWTQNWSWRPSPERGEITETTSVCQLCPGGCGIIARLVNGHRAIYIKGNPDHAVTHGGLCPVGAAGLQYLYAAYRIPHPLKQTSKRGDLKGFQPISWKDALKEVGAKLAEIRKKGPHSLACITGQTRSSMADLWKQFFAAYGSPNLYTMPQESDSRRLAAALTTGLDADLGFQLEKASYVLNFGAPLLEGWGSPGRMQQIFAQWRTERAGVPRTILVHVEPRCSLTASKADRWIPCNPGTEAALALGIAHVIVREKLYHPDFIADQTFGFEDWTDAAGAQRKGFKSILLAKYGPQEVSGITGVDPQVIQDLARELARQKNAVVLWGQGKGETPNNIYHDLAFFALNALLGNFAANGLVFLVPAPQWQAMPEPATDMEAFKGLGQKPLGQPMSVPKTKVRTNTVHAFLDALAGGSEYPVELLFVHEANPVYSLPENQLAVQALQKAGMVVSFSSYMDETAAYADLILPNHCAFERTDDIIGLPGAPYQYYAVASPILKPQHDTRATGDVLLSLAKKLGDSTAKSLPWKNYEAFLKERAAKIAQGATGMLADASNFDPASIQPGKPLKPNFKKPAEVWKKLKAGMCWVDAPPAQGSFETPSRRYELACQGLLASVSTNAGDELFMAHYSPLQPSGDANEFPLLLTTYDTLSLASGYLPNAPFMNKLLPDDLLLQQDVFVEIHPETAKKLHLPDKARVQLKTPVGEAVVRIRITDMARPGVVALPTGLGHTAYDEYVQNKGVNANSLIEVHLDPVTGLGTTWVTRAQLRLA